MCYALNNPRIDMVNNNLAILTPFNTCIDNYVGSNNEFYKL